MRWCNREYQNSVCAFILIKLIGKKIQTSVILPIISVVRKRKEKATR